MSLAGVAAMRADLKKNGVKVSVNDCVVYAAARALAASPKINATWDDVKGIAVTHPTVRGGLPVPYSTLVIPRSLFQLA